MDDTEGAFQAPRNTAEGLDMEDFKFKGPELETLNESVPALIHREIPNSGIAFPESQLTIPKLPVFLNIVLDRGINVEIKKFDFTLARPDYTWVFYGKRRTGKTHLIRCAMKAFRPWYPEAFVFTGTRIDAEYEACVPKRYIFQGFQESVLEMIMDRQERRVEALRKKGENNENIYVLVVLDDCITEKMDLATSEVIRRAFFNGRHLYMSIMINSQDLKALGPNLRANTDMVASFRVRSERDKEAVRTNYADFFKNDEEFDAVANPVAEIPFNVLFFDQSRPYMQPQDSVYCAIMPPNTEVFPFFMGSRAFWRGSEQQLIKYGGEELIDVDDWGIVHNTYNFKMKGIEEDAIVPVKKSWFKERPDVFKQEHIATRTIHASTYKGEDGGSDPLDADRARRRRAAQDRKRTGGTS